MVWITHDHDIYRLYWIKRLHRNPVIKVNQHSHRCIGACNHYVLCVESDDRRLWSVVGILENWSRFLSSLIFSCDRSVHGHCVLFYAGQHRISIHRTQNRTDVCPQLALARGWFSMQWTQYMCKNEFISAFLSIVKSSQIIFSLVSRFSEFFVFASVSFVDRCGWCALFAHHFRWKQNVSSPYFFFFA